MVLVSRRELISIHALREEGDKVKLELTYLMIEFLSTPSARRATIFPGFLAILTAISIHALREEGDSRYPGVMRKFHYFYPRPPRGGRPGRRRWLSMPYNFYPRPPRGGRPGAYLPRRSGCQISIHALREEGDLRPS